MADAVPNPSRSYITTLIPIQETVSWRVHNVSDLLETNAWSAVTIPMEVGLGATDLTRWNISLLTRNKDKKNILLCARAMLTSQHEIHKRITHNLRVAVVTSEGEEKGPVYYFPNDTNSNATNANLRNTNRRNNNNDNNNQCVKNLRRFFLKNVKLDEDDELGDGTRTKEARPGHKGFPSLWKVAPIQNIIPDEDDSIELRVTLTVYGCDTVLE